MYQTDSADAQTVKQQEYDKEYSVYTDKVNSYNRNVSIMTLIAAVILLHVSFYFEKRVKVLPDSIMLGGLFTLIYSVIRGFLSNDSKAVFIIVSIGLFTVIFIGYRRFVHVDKKLKKIKR
jgi:VIT1/CCC1 family predicted Fe2+/Mn2+ transporter